VKHVVTSIFLLLAVFFGTKDLMCFSGQLTDTGIYFYDIDEEESSGDTDDIYEKKDTDKCKPDFLVALSAFSHLLETEFDIHKVRQHYTPYFEISSPPPESLS
jgi:hypothetical protein